MTKIIKNILIIFILIPLFVTTAYAHPGRTDANGGHWNRSTGEYHYHTGEYAGKNSSGSTKPSDNVQFTPPYEPPAENPYSQNDDKPENSKSVWKIIGTTAGWIVIGLIIFFYLYGIIVAICAFIYEVFLEKWLPRYKIGILDDKINSLISCCTELAELKVKISSLENKLQIPYGYEIGKDNLPKDKNCNSKWGNTFTLYRTYNGGKLHTKYNCCSATAPKHIYLYRNYRNFENLLCQKCGRNYKIPNMTWYENYLFYQNADDNLKKVENKQRTLQKEVELKHKKCNSLFFNLLIFFSKKNKQKLSEVNKKYNEMRNKYF